VDCFGFASHDGGVAGLLAAITVNGPLGLAGTLAVNAFRPDDLWRRRSRQVRRRLVSKDLIAIGLVLAGSIAILASRAR
jgi:hypothetical protein